eukprot:m51a1_g4599 hypothetical protein (330) ;mRNA; f:226031-227449
MKATLALLALVALASAAELNTFRNWAAMHGKVYTKAQEARRFQAFLGNLKRIEELNEQGHALFGISPFADLTEDEFRSIYLRPMYHREKLERMPVKPNGDLPDNHDWRQATNPARVAPVKNQGSCGSCWAFSTVAHLENLAAEASNKLVTLSEQQLVDCDHECADPQDKDSCDSGCNGGLMDNAMRYVLGNGGIESEADYKYTGKDGKCAFDRSRVAATFSGNVTILPADEEAIRAKLYEVGPISIGVHADPWQFYFGGIYDHTSCTSDPAKMDHGVALVGWGHDASSGKDFWIIRNSWGASWGEKGYIRIRRGFNMCGLANEATIIAH